MLFRSLEDDRATLRAAGHVEPAGDVEVRVGVPERAGRGVAEEGAGLLVRDDLVAAPRVEQLGDRGQERAGPVVALVLGQEPAAAEVLAGERIPGGDDVPRRPPAGEVVQRRNSRATS